jgi:hypothetical protein
MPPKAGKAELDRSDWLRTMHMKDAPKIKRACSNIINLATLNDVVGLCYTTTPVTVTSAILYRISATVGTTGAVDVGVDGDDDCIINAAAIPAGLIDTVIVGTIADGAVAAGKMITASVETAVGTSGLGVICVEYREDD